MKKIFDEIRQILDEKKRTELEKITLKLNFKILILLTYIAYQRVKIC